MHPSKAEALERTRDDMTPLVDSYFLRNLPDDTDYPLQ